MHHKMILLVAALIAVIPGFSASQSRPAGVLTDTVEMRAMTETVTVFGQIVAVRQSNIATRIGGVVNEVPVQTGSVVEQGDIIAVIDTARLAIELTGAEAELAIATAGLEVATAQSDRAQKAFERARDLTANSSISAAQLDDRASTLAEAQGGLAIAQARITAAQSAIELARYNLSNATVLAPFDGIVLEVQAQPGQFAASGSQVATLLDTGTMEVEANVPSRYIPALEVGRLVTGRNDAGDALSMTLRAVLPTEFSETRTRPVRFTLTEIEPSFAIGQPVTLDLPIGEARDVLTVPKDALIQARGGWTAFVNDEGKASPRTVTIGAALGETFEVLSGLVEGDEVVVRGNERLRPGQDIAPMGAGGPPGGGPPGEGPPPGAGGPPGGGPPSDVVSERPASTPAAPNAADTTADVERN
ncbi:efflux RND transporter periplasmic adaptor subunit [Ponticoccus sp. SC2-23]|nr:efflux RND transporter periplasmic adaptor subunit [Ponticoccus sp. SC6-9]MBM1223897.1 efflux RND transporter periplasmic adaptor subunit [Ponticoccus sp. SC6-15]MBM1230324.1 efflux RND transporter periplasmic adaptor subunit [Ponticoccus sp. SC6-38]MBM1232863.1 efflux RND transporter periplasmic adaptor subunit [Ponticoccus sp. SC6-45]MBM1237187.1 efflux RND transporter periplasmic adaptor subunit [Ponticoccus sp. SC6-49]MBM1241874.1 efflux RND transporter periplasmic adaptor subunit [Pont